MPRNEHVGEHSIWLDVRDRKNARDQQRFTLRVENTNDPPVFIGAPDTIAFVDSLYQCQVAAQEIDAGDRVILDGPAVLGLADCRMLGRMVDAALLVVRSGTHALRPLQRAKAMLEQSRVAIAGIVFNGLSEDYRDWSSYGSPAGDGLAVRPGRLLGAPQDEDASLVMAGAFGA